MIYAGLLFVEALLLVQKFISKNIHYDYSTEVLSFSLIKSVLFDAVVACFLLFVVVALCLFATAIFALSLKLPNDPSTDLAVIGSYEASRHVVSTGMSKIVNILHSTQGLKKPVSRFQ